MKGVIFTSFLTMVEDKFGLEVADTVIEESELSTNGAYTAVGTYPTTDMVNMVVKLSEASGLSIEILLEEFGKYLFSILHVSYPNCFPHDVGFYEFMGAIHDNIHVEVLKLYPEAELPVFKTLAYTPGKAITLRYESPRKMSVLARGLIKGAASHFKQPIKIEEKQIDGNGSIVDFEITSG